MDTVILNVGGEHFETTVQTLISNSKYFESFFSRWNCDPSTKIFIDRDPGIFTHVLRLMRDPSYNYPQKYLSELDFFQITYTTSPEIIENDDMMMERKLYAIVIERFTGLSQIELKILLDRIHCDIQNEINSDKLNDGRPIELFYNKDINKSEIRDILSKIHYSREVEQIIAESIKSYIPDFMFSIMFSILSGYYSFNIVIKTPLINIVTKTPSISMKDNFQQKIAKKIIEYINNNK